MFVAGFRSTQPSSSFQQQASGLLAQQGLAIPANQLYYDSFVDGLQDQPASFGLQKSQAGFLVRLLQVLRSPSGRPNPGSRLEVTSPFEEALVAHAARLSPDPFPSCPLQQNLWTMRHVSELLGIQLKVYTEFDGFLSCRKVGTKSVRRVCLFANPDNQYIVLSKTFSPSDELSSTSASFQIEPTGSGSPKSPFEFTGCDDKLAGSRAPLASAEWSAGDCHAPEIRFTRSYAPSYPTPVPQCALCVAPWARTGLSPKTIDYGCHQTPNSSCNSATNAHPSVPAIARSANLD